MQFYAQIRGFQPRPWKGKNTAETKYSGTFIVLDSCQNSPIMNTVVVDSDYDSEKQMTAAKSLVGKTCLVNVTALKSGYDGQPHLVATVEEQTA